MFDVSKATLDEVSTEIDKTIRKLGRLQALFSAMLQEDHARIERLIQDYQRKKLEEEQREQAGEAGLHPPAGQASSDV